MTEQAPEPTGDEIPDGTQIPVETDFDLGVEEGDAGVDDDGTEEWYEQGED